MFFLLDNKERIKAKRGLNFFLLVPLFFTGLCTMYFGYEAHTIFNSWELPYFDLLSKFHLLYKDDFGNITSYYYKILFQVQFFLQYALVFFSISFIFYKRTREESKAEKSEIMRGVTKLRGSQLRNMIKIESQKNKVSKKTTIKIKFFNYLVSKL